MGHPLLETHASVYSQFGEKPDQTRDFCCVEWASLNSRPLYAQGSVWGIPLLGSVLLECHGL